MHELMACQDLINVIEIFGQFLLVMNTDVLLIFVEIFEKEEFFIYSNENKSVSSYSNFIGKC
ncbi:hypothetical protein BpHYR1_044241 [Brachionus plicatilis]|uniref:Uncharacterized protein n=1 Tax=Brachionus plicatilis TaxID=10195 RepID=A0A3M7PK40_BRAPC|nr:hypothetical protein BpHYR1_044241 [Brachionus plicatilis]